MPEILSVGSEREPPSPRRRLLLGLAALVAAALVVFWLSRPGPAPLAGGTPDPAESSGSDTVDLPWSSPTTPVPPLPVPAGVPAALAVAVDPPGVSLERRDSTADRGPWGVVVRRGDGSLGHHGAVITFPVAAARGGRRVPVGTARGVAVQNSITWPIAGGYARIRGDLREADLVAIAASTQVRSGHPVADPPPGFSGVAAEQYEPSVIREIRYSDLGRGDDFGLTYTGVITAAGFEDQLYASKVIDGGTVAGHPAVASELLGGNGTLAWEPAPGVVVYVGYSGMAAFSTGTIARLRVVANAGRLLDGPQWQATRPAVTEQVNAFTFDDYG